LQSEILPTPAFLQHFPLTRIYFLNLPHPSSTVHLPPDTTQNLIPYRVWHLAYPLPVPSERPRPAMIIFTLIHRAPRVASGPTDVIHDAPLMLYRRRRPIVDRTICLPTPPPALTYTGTCSSNAYAIRAFPISPSFPHISSVNPLTASQLRTRRPNPQALCYSCMPALSSNEPSTRSP
jgi:hypothetical protein